MVETGRLTDGVALFPGDGEMAHRLRTFDWAATPLGAPETWSQSLRTMVTFLLGNRFPLLLWWGPDQLQIYNDPYRPVLGVKHPASIGQPARECFPEIWDIIGPLILTPYNGGPATWDDDLFLEVYRHGFTEETHFTIAYSPVPDETVPSGIGGVLATVHEITQQVIQERRLALLRDLGALSAEARSAAEAAENAAAAFARHPKDIPFALIYLLDAEQRGARLIAESGVAPGESISPLVIEVASEREANQPWPLTTAVRTAELQIVDHLEGRFDSVPPGPWSDRPEKAVVLPIPSNLPHRLAGLLVLGISSRLEFDAAYLSFCKLVSAQVATALANAEAFEAERRRAQELAELDRAKTLFFSNVSHEFRTPLTLSIGPVEDALADPEHPLAAEQRQRLEIVQRNHLRLLKLVNSLLDFSRIEAGRIQASYEPTDLAASTTELASVFRSAVERAGLRLIVDCPPLREPIYVDREMWEKVVLNLLSNAFKFTFDGEIRVGLTLDDGAAELTVIDTGVGIPEAEIPRLFERFHRVEGTRARTFEGSGIGLALVQELVRLHGGAVEVASTLGEGSRFSVRIPTGSAHLPADRLRAAPSLASTALGTAPYIEEALRWLPDQLIPGGAAVPTVLEPSYDVPYDASPRAPSSEVATARILIADDNADMRDYLRRLLGARFQVETVPDGRMALEVIEARRPDLVLTDVMMPNLDGFGLLQHLRDAPETRTLPVILLSARAGEDSRVEGLQAGADDYLVKPFAARELLARVESHLELARVRRAGERRLLEAQERLQVALASEQAARQDAERAVRARDEFLSVAAHELKTPITSLSGAAQLEQRRLQLNGGIDPERAAQAFGLISRQSVKLVTLINQLLDVSRLVMGRLSLEPSAGDLSALVAEMAELAQERTDRHPITVRTPGPVIAVADHLRLEQVLTNLLDNAIKYSPAGGAIDVEVAQPSRATVVIRMRDHGLGVPPEHRERIFDQFYQAHRDLGLAGLGVGLFVSRQIVALHGGELRFESPSDGGSCFIVELPL